jgi:hypothetical protein
MSTHEGIHPIDPATAERLLGGARGTGHDRIADLLAAAAAPAGSDEFGGESAAMAAFRAAQLHPFPRPQRPSMIKSTLAKILTVKIAALCAGVAGVGGVALAATTGTIPSPLHLGAPSASASPRPHPSGKPSIDPSARPGHDGTPPGIAWLCHDYVGKDRDHRGKALDDPKFKELITKSGKKDRDRVDKFCGKLLHDWPSALPTNLPSDFPSVRPSDRREPVAPSGRPGNDSDAHPSSSPSTTRPTGSSSPHEAR